ncbi:MAG TPA: site-specific integrase [Rickettsiales bacterium]|nr:site-specific integrase [Rickettsiales bacterium]
MTRYNAENERIKEKYFTYELEANGKSKKTVENIRKALTRYEEFTGHASFKLFNDTCAVEFKAHLLKAQNKHGKPLSASTIAHTLLPLMDFLKWLAVQPSYKSRIQYADINYLKLKDKDRRSLQPVTLKQYPSSAQIKAVLAAMPNNTDIEKRNKAIIAFVFATGVRDGALITLKLKHLNIVKKQLVQNPKEVDTKFGKHIYTRFYPVGEDIHQIITDWVSYIREVKLFTDNDPLFPKEELIHDEEMGFKGGTLSHEHWKSASTVRGIFKQAFAKATLPYYSPHRFRDTLSAIGREVCTTTEEQMAWARNMGHENPGTTFITYGGFTPEQQFAAIERIGNNAGQVERLIDANAIAEAVAKRLGK